MEDQFSPYRSFDSIVHQSYETAAASGSNQSGPASPFINGFQQLLGEAAEPDPLFFIETWTLGAPAAIENFKLRQPVQADRTPQNRAGWGTGHASSESFVSSQSYFHPNAFDWSVFVAVHAVVTENCNPAPSQNAPFEQDRSNSGNLSNQDEALPMNLEGARRLLGVTPASTLSQIKSAHRQLVIEWHPDRLQNQPEAVRRHATGKMTAINEAYRLLRNDLLQHSA